ncbi:hypothetical protein [Antrihabitans sp. YC2-6]|uniref:hypothetical protein n=1 Tax=Antrihabitans sp. YC2-6 TaxID=2799498 RepID=UPI0018F38119|nr:hypothetical protein [Antrihabitans sp. YC2-6]MBJ8345225.1 hypothetical protein [Antrihabitans sp. YC2-6]
MSESTTKVIENVRKPIYATVGVSDAAVQAVSDIAVKVRERAERANGEVSGRVEEARTRLSTLTADVQEQFESLRERLSELQSSLPDDVAELRSKLTADEIKKLADEYRTVAVDRYAEYAQRGEGTVERLRTRPAYTTTVARTEEALGKVSERTRTVGEQAAKIVERFAGRVEETADTVADKIEV